MGVNSLHFLFFTHIIYMFAHMKQLEIPFEFVKDTNKIRLYKTKDWILVDSNLNDPISKKVYGKPYHHLYSIDLKGKGKVYKRDSVESNVLLSDLDGTKITIQDYICLSNVLKNNNLKLNKKKIEIYGFP